MQLIERSISHHKQKGNLSNVMQDMKIQHRKQTRLEFYMKTQNGKNHREKRGEFTIFCVTIGVYSILLFLFFYVLALSISRLCCNGWSVSFSVIHDLLLRPFHICYDCCASLLGLTCQDIRHHL